MLAHGVLLLRRSIGASIFSINFCKASNSAAVVALLNISIQMCVKD